jgi:hypothetical protein
VLESNGATPGVSNVVMSAPSVRGRKALNSMRRRIRTREKINWEVILIDLTIRGSADTLV